MGLCNRFCCVGRAGRWLGGPGPVVGWSGRVRGGAAPGRTRCGCARDGVSSRALQGLLPRQPRSVLATVVNRLDPLSRCERDL